MRTTTALILALAILGSIYCDEGEITSNCDSPFKKLITAKLGSEAINNTPKEETTYCSTEFSNTKLSVKGSCCNKDKVNSFHQSNMDTLKKEMLDFTQWVYDIKTAFEKSKTETELSTKITNLQAWAAAELKKKPRGKEDTGKEIDYMNVKIAKYQAIYTELSKFLTYANTEGFYKKDYMTALIASLKANGQKCLNYWDTFLKKSFCMLCSPRVNTFFNDDKLILTESQAKLLLRNCGDMWYYTGSLTLTAKAIAFHMNAHANKEDYKTEYLTMEPRPDFDLTNFLTALKELKGVTDETLDTAWGKFKTANGENNMINSFLYWNKWNPLLWGNAKDLEFAAAILNTANPKPAESRLLANKPTLNDGSRRILDGIAKATGQWRRTTDTETTLGIKFADFDGITATTDVKVAFEKTGEKVDRSSGIVKIVASLLIFISFITLN